MERDDILILISYKLIINNLILILMISRTAKSIIRLNNNIGRMNFCFNQALLDPSKHNSMNHRGHNIYIDLYDFGEYP